MAQVRDQGALTVGWRPSRRTLAMTAGFFAAALLAALAIPRALDWPEGGAIAEGLAAERASLAASLPPGVEEPIVESLAAPEPAGEADEPRQVRGGEGGGEVFAAGTAGGLVDVGGALRLAVGDPRGGGGAGERGLRGARPRDPRAVRARVRELRGAIQRCYERRMATAGAREGLLEIEVEVTPAGSVHNARLRPGSPFDDRVLASCVRSRLDGLELGRGPAERYVVPIRFVATEPER